MKSMKKKVVKHLKGDIKTFHKEAEEDKELIKSIRGANKKQHSPKKRRAKPKKSGKVGKVMHEWKAGKLHSGSKKGPVVKNRKQAMAIALSESRKAGENVKKAKKRR